MSAIRLPAPPPVYDVRDQGELRRSVELELARVSQPDPDRWILTDADGARWKVVVSTAGVLSTVAA